MGVVLLLLLLLKAHNGLSYTNKQILILILIFDELVQGAADGSSMGAL